MTSPDPIVHVEKEADKRVERVLVIKDVPNILHSAYRAAGDRPGARFSFNNIVAAIDRSVAPGFTSRQVVERIAVSFASENFKLVQTMRTLLERAGFHVETAANKTAPSRSRDSVGSLRSGRSRGDVISSASQIDHQPYRDETGVVDLELTNIVWDKVFQRAVTPNPITKKIEPLHTVVLISGDGDYTGLVERLKKYGVRIEVYGPRNATSDRLRSRADKCVDMSQDTPQDVPEDQRFIFFESSTHEHSSSRASRDKKGYAGYSLPDSRRPAVSHGERDEDRVYRASSTGEFDVLAFRKDQQKTTSVG